LDLQETAGFTRRQSSLFPASVGKKILIFAFRRPFFGPDDLEYVAKTGAVERPLMAVWRGANLPYFGKRGDN